MPRIDFFNFFRWVLALFVTVYATVVTLQSMWGWYVMLRGREKYVSMLRRYIILHTLRLRFKTFWGDVLICILLCVAFVIMWYLHRVLFEVGDLLADAGQLAQRY